MTGPALATDTFGVFGTTAVLVLADPGALPAARAMADSELAAVDRACSRFRPDSELCRVNGADGRLTGVSELFSTLLDTALRAAELTGGDVDPTCGRALVAAGYDRDFSELRARAAQGGGRDADGGPNADGRAEPAQAPREQPAQAPREQPAQAPGQQGEGRRAIPVPGEPSARRRAVPVPGWHCVLLDAERRLVRLDHGAQLDLGATAKAWAADRCAGLIAARFGCGVLVSLGGDVAVAGPPPAEGWQVRVSDDHAAAVTAVGQTVTIRSGGLATSSTTVRTWTADGRIMHHIIDPQTAEPVRSCWRTVSVAAGSCVDANVASTASIIRGEAALSWLAEAGLPARLVYGDGSVRTVAGWPADPGSPSDGG